MKLIVCVLILSGLVAASPIGVTGGGSGECGFSAPEPFGFWTASFGGPGVSVSITVNGPGDFCGPNDSGLHFATDGVSDTGQAFIGSLNSHSFAVQLSADGSGFLTLFDSTRSVLASVDLIGYVKVTSFVTTDCRPGGVGPTCTDNKSRFIITNVPDVPEPSGASLLLLGGGVFSLAGLTLRAKLTPGKIGMKWRQR